MFYGADSLVRRLICQLIAYACLFSRKAARVIFTLLVVMIRKYLELNAESDSFVGLGKVYRRTVWVREAYGRVVVVVAAEWIATRHQRT